LVRECFDFVGLFHGGGVRVGQFLAPYTMISTRRLGA
jgi:hypothetical protein